MDLILRAWDGEEMLYSEDVGLLRFFELVEGDQFDDCFTPVDDNIMPYIGRKDVLGKKIYEGDITGQGTVKYYEALVWDSKGSSHPGFYFKGDLTNGERELGFPASFDDCLVLGNIYENPELLKNRL